MSRVAPVAMASSLTVATTAQAEGEKPMYLALAAGAAVLGYAAYSNTTSLASVEERVGSLEIARARKESSAFVFVKPHAVTEPVKALVKAKLGEAGISIVSEGEIAGPTIDEKMLIDTHYGAIAEKAVVLKPSQLSPSAKAIAEFEKTFGLPWSEAVAKGMVYNARDACAKLGIDGDGLDKKWATLKRGVNLIKFGGGFYCGHVDGLYVINGFYMSMRGKFTKPEASIYYLLVEWPTASLAWEDFRGNVLGATNPKDAAPGSLRKLIANDWKALGLAAEPDTGDNGVHASASPFEALAERINWTGATVDTDAFGKAMLASGIPAKTVLAWTEDPQVPLPAGGKGSLFDALEDLSSDACLDKAVAIADAAK